MQMYSIIIFVDRALVTYELALVWYFLSEGSGSNYYQNTTVHIKVLHSNYIYCIILWLHQRLESCSNLIDIT